MMRDKLLNMVDCVRSKRYVIFVDTYRAQYEQMNNITQRNLTLHATHDM